MEAYVLANDIKELEETKTRKIVGVRFALEIFGDRKLKWFTAYGENGKETDHSRKWFYVGKIFLE